MNLRVYAYAYIYAWLCMGEALQTVSFSTDTKPKCYISRSECVKDIPSDAVIILSFTSSFHEIIQIMLN